MTTFEQRAADDQVGRRSRWLSDTLARLRRSGIRSTLHLDPASREARLEVWPGQDAAQVQAVLDALRRPARSRLRHRPHSPLSRAKRSDPD